MLESGTRHAAEDDGFLSRVRVIPVSIPLQHMIPSFWLCTLAAKSQQKIDQVKADLEKRFHVKDMAELYYFLGVCVKQNPETGKIWIGQQAYTEAVIKKFESY